MSIIKSIENKLNNSSKKTLSFPTKEFKKVEYYDNDGKRSEGYMVNKDKFECEIISGLKKVTLPNDKVNEIKSSTLAAEQTRATNEQPEDKFNFLKQYQGNDVPEDYCMVGIDAYGNEELIIGDVAAIDAMDDDPDTWVFVDAKSRSQMIVNRHDIHDIRPDKESHYHYIETDENGNEATYHGYLSKVLNGRCFFECIDSDEIMLVDSEKVFSSKNMKSVKENWQTIEENNEVTIELPSQESKKEKFDFREELISRLDYVAINPTPRTEQQRFIELGKTKTLIHETKEEEKHVEETMADYFVNKSARDLMTLSRCGLFQYFEQYGHEDLKYEVIYERFESIRDQWKEVTQELSTHFGEISQFDKSRERESQNRFFTRRETKLKEKKTKILKNMNFIKKQINKLNYLKHFDQKLKKSLWICKMVMLNLPMQMLQV